jgi:flagellar hook-associated protein 2
LVEEKTIKALSDIGIQFNRNGLLDFDEKKFGHSLQGEFDEVVDLLAGDGRTYGVITKLHNAVRSISNKYDGLLSNQKKNYTDNLREIGK